MGTLWHLQCAIPQPELLFPQVSLGVFLAFFIFPKSVQRIGSGPICNMTSILAQAKVGQKRHRSGGGGGALAVAVVLVPPPVPPMLTLCFVCVARLGLCCLARLALLRLHQGRVTDLLARAERSWPRAKMGGAAALALLSWRRGTAADALARTAHSQLKWGGGSGACFAWLAWLALGSGHTIWGEEGTNPLVLFLCIPMSSMCNLPK